MVRSYNRLPPGSRLYAIDSSHCKHFGEGHLLVGNQNAEHNRIGSLSFVLSNIIIWARCSAADGLIADSFVPGSV
jgi:hypothetical protein